MLQRGKGRSDVAKVGDQKITEPGARYVDFLVPGLIGMNLRGSGLWGLGFTVVIARARKLLKRFAATPMRPGLRIRESSAPPPLTATIIFAGRSSRRTVGSPPDILGWHPWQAAHPSHQSPQLRNVGPGLG